MARPGLGRPIAAPLDRCAELLGVDLANLREAAAKVEPYIRADGTRIWSLMQLERHLRRDLQVRVERSPGSQSRVRPAVSFAENTSAANSRSTSDDPDFF